MAISPYQISNTLGQQIDSEPAFAPLFDVSQTQQLINQYNVSPTMFSPEELEKIKKHAYYHQVPMYEGEFTVGEALKQFAQGVFSGFTTFNVGKPPDNEYEGIARSIGHLVGFAPGMVARPFLKLKATSGWAQKLAGIKSAPMWAAEKIRKKATDITGPAIRSAIAGKAGAVGTAGKFLTSKKATHIMEGAFDLGIASGLSAWQGGVNAMLESAFHGAAAGGVFRGLGNAVNMGDPTATKLTRALAGSLYLGLQAEYRGATTPEKVYEYLLGGFFGYGEAPYYRAGAAKFMKKFQEKRGPNAEMDITKDPELMGKDWAKLDVREQKEVKKQISDTFFNGGDINTGRFAGTVLLEKMGPEYLDKYGNVTKESWEKLRNTLRGKPLEGVDISEAVEPAQERLGKKLSKLTEGIEKSKSDIKVLRTAYDIEEKAFKETGKRSPKLIYAEQRIGELTEKIVKDEQFKIQLEAGLGKKPIVEKVENEDTDSDVSERTSDPRTGNRSAWWTDKWLKDLYEIDANQAIKRDLKTVLSARVYKEIKKHIEPESGKDPDIDALSETLQKELGTPIVPEARGELKQWLTRLNKGVHQNYMRVVYTPGKKGTSTAPGRPAKVVWQPMFIKRPMTKAGNKKDNIEPIKVIEEIYLKESGGEVDPDWGNVIHVDHMSMKNKSGQWKDYTLGQMRKDNPGKYKKALRQIVASMHNKDFYVFGGRGDSDKLMFVKYHPRVKELSNSAVLSKLIGPRGERNAAYKDAFNLFKKQFPNIKPGKARTIFDKAFASNVLYDVGVQGYDYTRANYLKMWDSTDKNAFLNNALDYNKRLQILLTPSWAGNKKLADKTFEDDKAYKKHGGFRASLIEDVEGPKEHKEMLYNMLAEKFVEKTDGAIIVRDNILDFFNVDSGNPKSGQNKSFIISPHSEHGALLGKFMFHKAGPKMSAEMEKTGHHMLIYKSSAKQRGTREVGNYQLSPKGKLTVNAPTYTIDPAHVKYNYSVKQGSKMYTEDSRIPKQWFSALNSRTAYKPIPLDVIDDIFNSTISKSYKGDISPGGWNEKLADYLVSPTNSKLTGLLKNMDKIGINELLEAMYKNEGSQFADAAYEKMFKLNTELTIENAREDGLKESELSEYRREIDDFDSITNRMLKRAHKIAKGNDLKASAIYNHKIIRPYRLNVMRNYIMSNIVKPKIGNSAAARMRPYDKAMMMNLDEATGGSKFLKELNTKDDIFFLDNNYRDMPIRTHLGGKWAETTLGKFWDAWTGKESKKQFKGLESEVDEIFRAMAVRVPMDSVSGAQALKFRGFTGRDGHGILLHPRKMKQLGGADLDGDEAFVYFGGKDARGIGSGMKKTWKDAFEANKDEYVEYVSKEKIKGKYKYLTRDEYDNLSKKTKDKVKIKKFNPAKELKSLYEKAEKMTGNILNPDEVLSHKKGYKEFLISWKKPNGIKRISGKPITLIAKEDPIAGKTIGSGKILDNKVVQSLMKKQKFFVFRDRTRLIDNWTVTDANTGLRVAGGDTMNNAIESSNRLFYDFFIKHLKDSKPPTILKQEQFARYIPDPKKGMVNRPDGKRSGMTMEDLLTESGEDFGFKSSSRYNASRVWMYAPSVRLAVSEKVVDGRGLMGGVVSMSQTMKSAHDLIASTKKGSDTFKFLDWSKKVEVKTEDQANVPKARDGKFYFVPEYEIVVKARTNKEWLDYARRLTASMTAFTADPMDTGGLRPYPEYFKELYDAYFEMGSIRRLPQPKSKNKGGKFAMPNLDAFFENFKPKKGGKSPIWHLRNGILKDFMDMNGALFGRNWKQGRAFHEHEIRNRVEFIDKFENENLTNIMAKQAKLVKDSPQWTDDIFNKLDAKKLRTLYTDMNKMAEDYKFLAGMMGRSSFTIPPSLFIKKIFDFELNDPMKRDILSVDKYHNKFKSIFSFKGKDNALGYTRNKRETSEQFIKNIDNLTKEEKVEILDDIYIKGMDFITNDIHQMISIKKLTELYDANKDELTLKVIQDIFNEVERTKQSSYLMAKDRNDTDIFYTRRENMEPYEIEAYDYVMKKQIERGEIKPEEISAEMDQNQVDARIKAYKNKLDSKVKEKLYDYLMLGSFNRSRMDAATKALVKEYIDKGKELDPDIKHAVIMNGAKTSLTRLGYNSNSIETSSLDAFLKEYMNLSAGVFKADKTGLQKAIDASKKMEEVEVTVDGQDGSVKLFERNAPIGVEAEEYLGENLSGYIGLKKGPLTPEATKIMTELAENLKYYDKGKTLNLNEITRWLLKKDMNAMDMQDWKIMNGIFKDHRSGSFAQKLFKEDSPDMKKRFWSLFPEKVSKSMMKYDIEFIKEKGYFKTADGKWVEEAGWVRRPQWVLEGLQHWNGTLAAKATDLSEQLQLELNSTLSFYTDALPEGEKLRLIAVSKMELGQINRVLYSKSNSEETGGINKSNELRRHDAKSYSDNYLKEIGATTKDIDTAEPTGEAKLVLEKKYNITHPDGIKEKITGWEVVDKIQKTYTAMNKRAHEMITGKPEALDPYRTGTFFDRKKQEEKLNWVKFVNDIGNLYKQGKPLPTDLGIDGVRKIARSMMIDLTPETPQGKIIRKKLIKTKMTRTGQLDFESYYPHMFMSAREAKAAMEKSFGYIKNDSRLSEDQKVVEMKKILLRTHNLTGDWMDPGQEIYDSFDRAVTELNVSKKKREEFINWWDANQTMGSMHSRNTHIPGWDRGRDTYEVYLRNIGHTYFNQINQIFSRNMIESFKQRMRTKPFEWHKEKTGYFRNEKGEKVESTLLDNWVNYLKLYTQDAMGNPSVIPEKIYSDPAMKLKGTPYYWWADNRIKKKMEVIKKVIMGDKETKYPELDKLMEKMDYTTLNRISNLEAKFELASLLAHPKASVANAFGGSIHTIQSAGFDNFKKGRDIKYLNKINPEWKTMADIDAMVTRQGVIPEFILHQFGVDPTMRAANVENFAKDIGKKMSKSGELDANTFKDLVSKHRVGKGVMDLAAKFMSIPERHLRRDAYMAHLVRAYEMFDGSIKNLEHPFLVELAKKGVKATQFLYSAPYRPAFARTSLGKIMSRFQLWQWNAVKFRNDITKEAKIYGIAPGTPEFERFTRTLQADMFVFAMGNAFAYSIFDTAMPAPWAWFQDTADWIYGNENERERAFFGAWPTGLAPLQLVTPPIMRHPLSIAKSLYSGDWERFANYHIYTAFPFGRLAKDFLAPNNLIENPMGLIDKWTGFPMQKLQSESKKMRKGMGPWYPWHPHGIEREIGME